MDSTTGQIQGLTIGLEAILTRLGTNDEALPQAVVRQAEILTCCPAVCLPVFNATAHVAGNNMKAGDVALKFMSG
ncbi:hypothetical protein MFIFM68171_00830 [Madurella fahalii]|uniref:Uncharacterized protein n=1 Tax=Madurella fahalii TaxID=1157608 RepID=A0ABQ0FZ77_9PEZI